jgi:transposase
MDKEGTVIVDKEFKTSEANLVEAFKTIPGEVHVHLEAAELAAWIRRTLIGRVKRVVVGDTKTSAWIAKDPLKADRLDAGKLADLLRMNRVHEVFYSDDDERTVFKQIVQHYDDVTRQQVRLKLKIKARFRVQGLIAKSDDVYTSQGRSAWVKQIRSAAAREAVVQLYSLLDQTLKAQKDAFKLMKRQAKSFPEVKLFDEVPGVGPIGACRFSAYVQTPHRFSSKRKLWRYARLGITDRSSDGKSIGRQMLDRNGVGRLKDMSRKAFQGAMMRRSDNMFKRFYRASLKVTHSEVHSRLSTQRKILSVLRALWLSGRRFEDNRG